MVKKITLSVVGLLFVAGMMAQPITFKHSLYGGNVNIMGIMLDIPDMANWHYFSFETGTVIGTSAAELENVAGNNIGTEKIDAQWAARTDWDIAFHSTDIRTNGGAAVKIADSETSESLDEVFSNLTVAPTDGYVADELLTGSFIFAMTSMPPLRTTQLSACGATNGWAVFGMGSSECKPTVVVFKTASGKYVKVHLKKFFGEGTEESPAVGDFEMDYEVFTDPSAVGGVQPEQKSMYVADGMLYTSVSNANVEIYNLAGTMVKTTRGESVSVGDLNKGVYVVKASSERENSVQKIIIR